MNSKTIRRLGTWALTIATALCVASPASASSSKRTVFLNGKIFTANPSAPWAEAIAVQGDKILKVGSNASVQGFITPKTSVRNLGGRTVVPGLNDAHVHVLSAPGVYINVPSFIPGPGPALGEVLDMIQTATTTYPAGTWLIVTVGTGLTEDLDANRFALDTVSPNHPVKLEVWTGHGTYLNTKALDVLDIDEEEPDPLGGHYERVEGTSILTGEVHEYAEHHVRRKMLALMSNTQAAAHYKTFATEAASYGFTSLQDMAVGMTQSRSIEILKKADVPLRVRSICFPLSPNEPCDDSKLPKDHPRIKASGIKWVTDGTPIERLAFLNGSYADKPGSSGQFNLPGPALFSALTRGWIGHPNRNQLLFHAVGDGAIDTVLNAMELMGGPWAWNGRRTRIEHGDLLPSHDFERVADLGAVIVQNATHLALTEVMHERLHPDTVQELQPLASLLDNGIPLALGTDGIGRVMNPWLDIFLAATHPSQPTEAISVEQAIVAYTHGSAYAEFEEHKKGVLAPGKAADLAVLSQDVFSAPVYALPGTTSVLTMVDGNVVWDTGAVAK